MTEPRGTLDWRDVVLVNCHGCGHSLLSHKMRGFVLPKSYQKMEWAAGKINGMTYCRECLDIKLIMSEER